MTTREMQNEILRLKKGNDICILAHVYQSQDILEVADYTGDSFAISEAAAKAPEKNILMCGVRFMAETAKILSPEKKVILCNSSAGCPMAEQIDLDNLNRIKENNKGYAIAAYINTTAELKTGCDVCVTSSSAVKIIKRMPQKDIVFIPDCNLGDYVKRQVPEKNIKLVNGGCPTHSRITVKDVREKRAAHPNAVLLAHPECRPEVVKEADFVGSTTQIMDFAKESTATEFIIGTDNSIVQHLQFSCPNKEFYPLSMDCYCHNMLVTTLPNVLSAVKLQGGEEIILSDETIKKARLPIDEMLRLGSE